MKRCPECGREYDNTMMFCLDDGSELLYGPASMDEPQTAILYDTAGSDEAATRAQAFTTEQTAVLPSGPSQMSTPKVFDKRLVLAPLALSVIVLGGFLSYRYFSISTQIESIAVMPFVNESGDPTVEYLSDGMTETLISSLSQLPTLKVKPRSSVFRYKGKENDPQTLGRELNVQAVLTGRVAQRGQDLSLFVELVDVALDKVVWSRQYNRRQSDVLALQSEIARDVSGKLSSDISGPAEARLTRNHTADPKAYQLYLKGRFYWNKRTAADIKRSIAYFDQAIEIDPTYALAYAGLADAYQVLPSYTTQPPPEETYPKARLAAQKALQIDPSLAEPHAALGIVLSEYDWKFAEAEQEFRRAIELDPNYASAHQWYGEHLSRMGRSEEAIAELQRAQQLEPLSLIINSMLGFAYWSAGRYDEAMGEFRKSLELDPNFMTANFGVLQVYLSKGMYEEAIDQNRKLDLEDLPSEQADKRAAAFREAYRREGPRGFWQEQLNVAQAEARARNSEVPHTFLAYLHVKLGNNEQSLDALEQAFQSGKRFNQLVSLKGNPDWDPLRGEPRFKELLQKVGLPQ